jgi:hypothetical protein
LIANDLIAQQLGWTTNPTYPNALGEVDVIRHMQADGTGFLNDVQAGRVQLTPEGQARLTAALGNRQSYYDNRPNFGSANDQAVTQGLLSQFSAPQTPVEAPQEALQALAVPASGVAPTAPLAASGGLLAPLMPDASNAPVSPAMMLPQQQMPFDPADAARAGVTPEVYNSFLNDISGLNEAHRAGAISTDDYVRNFYQLTSQYGVNPVHRDGNRVSYFNPGIQFGSAQYDVSAEDLDRNPSDGLGIPNVWEIDRGQSATASALYPGAQPFRGFESEQMGGFIGDARTRNERNLIRDVGMFGLNTVANLGIGTLLGAGQAAIGSSFAPGSMDGGGGGDVFGAGTGAIFNPRIEGRPNNDRVTVDGERLNREQSADHIMQQVLAGMMGNRERFEIPAVENTPPETIEFPIEMPRLPVEAEEGGGSPDADVQEPTEPSDSAPAPPEAVFDDTDGASQPDEERRWRYIGDGIFVNIDTGARRSGGDGDYTIGDVYSGPSEDVAGEDGDGDLLSGIIDLIGGDSGLGSSIDAGLDFGPFLPGVAAGIGAAVGGGTGTGSGSGSGSGDGDGDGDGDGEGRRPQQPTMSLAQQQKEFEQYMTQVRYQVQMMQRPEFALRDYLAELMR